IGDQHAPLAALLELQQKVLGTRQIPHLSAGRALTLDESDVETQFAAPVLDAIPLHGAPRCAEFRFQKFRRFMRAQSIRCGVPAWYEFLPEPIIESQIE